MRLRALLWLVAVCALLLPPAANNAVAEAAGHAMPIGCHDSAPPPCPEDGTAKHVAGLCCAMMAQVVAVLPSDVPAVRPAAAVDVLAGVRSLTGLTPQKDPPPPRG